MLCPSCSTTLPDDDLFCESCGVRLGAPAEPAVCACGAPAGEIDEDGFCSRCGHRARRPASDHIEAVLSSDCAAVSDRGLKHARNEDRFGIRQAGNGYAFVVCDGVSTSRESERASTAVSGRVSEFLEAALIHGALADTEATVRKAIAAGEATLRAYPARDEQDNPPSTTVVAALVADGHATVGWVGDSRAYWIGAGGAHQLTSDHSWMNAVVSAGEMTAEEAEKAPQAHGITRWLGADAGENSRADTGRFPITGPGVLLLCSDGLWNYAPTPETMAGIVHEAIGNGGDALAAARRLIGFAIAQGGHDNITAVVLRC
jgi:serine/threonine protein phosphatase PrpC